MTASFAVFAAAVTITAARPAAVAVGSLVAGWKEHQRGSLTWTPSRRGTPCPATWSCPDGGEVRLRGRRDAGTRSPGRTRRTTELAHPDAVRYTGAALRDALEADRG